MIIGICTCEIYIFNANSLKSKRSVVKSIIEKSKNRFNISIAEVGENDSWQIAEIGIAVVANKAVFADEVINKIVHFIDNFDSVEIIDIDIEMID